MRTPARRLRLTSFLWRLTVALPVNLAVFRLALRGDVPAILLFGLIGAVAGALLLPAVQPRPTGLDRL